MLCSRVASVVNNELRLFYYSANKKPVVNKTHSASLCLLNSSIKSGIGKSLTRIFVRYDTYFKIQILKTNSTNIGIENKNYIWVPS